MSDKLQPVLSEKPVWSTPKLQRIVELSDATAAKSPFFSETNDPFFETIGPTS